MYTQNLARLICAMAEGDGQGSGSSGQGDGGNAGDRGGAGGGDGTTTGGQNSAQQDSGVGGSGTPHSGQDRSDQQGKPPEGRSLDNLPQWAQTMVRELRDEAAGHRTKRNAAESQMSELQRKVAAAFDIDVDGDGKPDPDKLSQDLAAAQDTARMRSVELAVYRASGDKNVDPAALMDSRSFLDSVADLDPNASDFQTRLHDKITQAAQDNPRLTAGGQNGTGSRPGGGIGQGGRGQQSGPVGVAAGRALHRERKGA